MAFGSNRTRQVFMPEVSKLPPSARMQRYIDLADDARREAAQASGAARTCYLIIAEQWELLATEAARELASERTQNQGQT